MELQLTHRCFNLEKTLADALRERAVNTLKSDLSFFQQLDSGILHSLCEKEKGSFYKSFSDRLENMLRCDEYAGVPKIIGLVYGTNCPLYIFNESNGNYVCGMKYGDDTFPNVEPIRLLYSPDTHDSPGHYAGWPQTWKTWKTWDFERLRSQGKLRELFIFVKKPGRLRENIKHVT